MNDELYMKSGRYTTCDNHDHPHFYMQMTYAKVRPKKNVVTGPAYLVIEDVPLPLAVPFSSFLSPVVIHRVSSCQVIWMTLPVDLV